MPQFSDRTGPENDDLISCRRSLYRLLSRLVWRLMPAGYTQIENLLRDALEAIAKRTDVSRIGLFIVPDPGKDDICVRLQAEWVAAGSSDGKKSGVSTPLKYWGNAATRLQRGLPARYENMQNQLPPEKILRALLADMNSEKCALLPLRYEQQLVGVLILATGNPSDFVLFDDEEICELLQTCGCALVSIYQSKAREAALSAQEEQWRSIAARACDFAVRVDERLKVEKVIAFQVANDLPPVNVSLLDCIPRQQHTLLRETLHDVREFRKLRLVEFQCGLHAGKDTWYLARCEPSESPDCGGATLFLTNINAEKLRADKDREIQDQLIRVQRFSQVGQMSTEMAHQLKQPLQAILFTAETVKRDLEGENPSSDDIYQTMDDIIARVEHCSNIIERIREFVRYGTLRFETLPLQKLFNGVDLLVRPSVHKYGAELSFPSPRVNYDVHLDLTQTQHVFVNLITNALEACRDAGIEDARISISVRPQADERRLHVFITDNGPGLPDGKDVFEEFYTSKKNGLGLGLNISRKVMVEQHGTLTAANNTDGPGATFTVTLPIVDELESDTDEIPVTPMSEDDLSID